MKSITITIFFSFITLTSLIAREDIPYWDLWLYEDFGASNVTDGYGNYFESYGYYQKDEYRTVYRFLDDVIAYGHDWSTGFDPVTKFISDLHNYEPDLDEWEYYDYENSVWLRSADWEPPCSCCGKKPCECLFCPTCGNRLSFLNDGTGSCGSSCTCQSDPCIGSGQNINSVENTAGKWSSDISSTDKMAELKGLATYLDNEQGAYLIYNPSDNTYRSSPWCYGGPTSVDITATYNPSTESIVATLHNHPAGGYPPPSAGDLYNIGGNCSFVITADVSEYCLYIDDHNKYSTFKNVYQKNSFVGSNARFLSGNSIGFDFNKVEQEYGYEKAMGYVLSKYDTGVVLLKGNNGTFGTEVHVIESEDSNGNAVYVVRDCSN